MFLSIPTQSHCLSQKPSSYQSEQPKLVSSRSLSPQPTGKVSETSLLTQSKQQLSTLQSIENGFYVANLYYRFQFMDSVLFALLVMNFTAIMVYSELSMQLVVPMTHRRSVDTIVNPLEANMIQQKCTMILYLNIIITAMATYEKVQKKHIEPIEQLYQILIIIIQPFPFLQNITLEIPLQLDYLGHIEMKLNLLLVILSISKCLLIARYLFWHNLCRFINIRSEKFFKPSYNRICKIYSCEKSYIHILKCLFQENFIVFIAGFYILCMTMSAYCIRIAETHYDGRFKNIGNCLWFTLLSMTTVGYGDTYVSTPIGIAIDGFLMFSGVVISSLLVSSLNDLFSMGYGQKRSLKLMKRLREKAELKQIAGKYIVQLLQRRFLQRKYKIQIKVSESQRLNCRLFHEKRMQLKNGKEKQLNLYRDMSSQFESLKVQLQQLMHTCEEDIQTLSQKQRLTLNRESHRQSSNMRNRSSSYLNILRLKSRDSRVSLMQPIFNNSNNELVQNGGKKNTMISNITCSFIQSQSGQQSSNETGNSSSGLSSELSSENSNSRKSINNISNNDNDNNRSSIYKKNRKFQIVKGKKENVFDMQV